MIFVFLIKGINIGVRINIVGVKFMIMLIIRIVIIMMINSRCGELINGCSKLEIIIGSLVMVISQVVMGL